MKNRIKEIVAESIRTKEAILNDDAMIGCVEAIALDVRDSIAAGGKLLVCGNGGSASDSLHLVGEIVGRFQREREPWSAISLNSEIAAMTAIANDYSYDDLFERQTRAHAKPGDVFIGISTSGNSENVVRAMAAAKDKGCKVEALAGRDGGKMAAIADNAVIVPSQVTARIQESHIMVIHAICELVEDALA